ncbi:MAG: TIGR03808 family TAT-translocated repetitive protein, partial [Devosia sp.]
DSRSGLLAFSKCERLRLDALDVHQGPGNGLFLSGCSGFVTGSHVGGHADAGIFAIDSHELTISQNQVIDCGNGGILVWQSQPGRDGTIVSGNHIARISARAGGNGQNGNGINIFRADNVIVADNVIETCDFSAIRANTTRNASIRGNTCTNLSETGIYSEFAFSGSVIANNIVDGAAAGISITNLDQGGRLAVCSGNIVRNILPKSPTNPDATPVGISAEADTAITGNTVSNVPGLGIGAGYGPYLRNVLIADNVITDTDTGIGVSVAPGAGPVRIAGNMISNARLHPIVGTQWDKLASTDLAANAGQFPNVSIEGNIVGP